MIIFRKSLEEVQFSLQSDKKTGTLHEDQHLFLIKSRTLLLRMRNVSDKSCRENQSRHFMFTNFFFENRNFYEVMQKNIVEYGSPQMKIWRMCIACWITKATQTHAQKMQYLQLSHCNNSCKNATHCYFIRTCITVFLTFCRILCTCSLLIQ